MIYFLYYILFICFVVEVKSENNKGVEIMKINRNMKINRKEYSKVDLVNLNAVYIYTNNLNIGDILCY